MSKLSYNGKNLLGWFLTGGSLLAMLVGIIASLNAHYQATSLYNTLIIFGLIAGGVGFILRSLKQHNDSEDAKNG